MTGYYIRALRDGRPVSIEVDELPDPALDAWVASLDDGAARRWLLDLSRWLGDRVRRTPREGVTDAFLEAGVAGLPGEDARRWLSALVRYIRDHEPGFGPGPDAPPSFTCPDCGRRSFHPEDARHRYCAACHRFF